MFKEVPYTYNGQRAGHHAGKRTVTEQRRVAKEVPYTYNVSVPVTTPENRTVTTYRCVAEEVVHQVPVCRYVRKEHVDANGWVRDTCERVTEMQDVKRMVTRRVPETKEVTVNVSRYETQQRQATAPSPSWCPDPRSDRQRLPL